MEMPKIVFGWPGWDRPTIVRMSKAKAAKTGHKPFHSSAAQRLTMVATLGTPFGPTLDARLRIEVWANRPMTDLSSTLEILDGDQWICASRIDINPPGDHNNIQWRALQIPAEIRGSHIHHFADNAKLGLEAFAPIGNLPAARPVEMEPSSFREFARMIGATFVIDGVEVLDAPEWQEGFI